MPLEDGRDRQHNDEEPNPEERDQISCSNIFHLYLKRRGPFPCISLSDTEKVDASGQTSKNGLSVGTGITGYRGAEVFTAGLLEFKPGP